MADLVAALRPAVEIEHNEKRPRRFPRLNVIMSLVRTFWCRAAVGSR